MELGVIAPICMEWGLLKCTPPLIVAFQISGFTRIQNMLGAG